MAIEFAPLVPGPFMAVMAALALLLAGLSLLQRVRGALFRVAALAALILALLNPVLTQAEREPLESVVAVVVDRSQSQSVQQRREATDAALSRLTEQLARFPRLDVRVVEVGNDQFVESPSTRLFEALNSALEDVPTSRIAGAIMITDGQVHDVPESASELGFAAPVHGLITGAPDEVDRRVQLVNAPRFGIVGEQQEFTYRVVEDGLQSGQVAEVTIRVNGEEYSRELAPIGQDMPLLIDIERAGDNVIELEVETVPGEISTTNNRAVAVLDGIRENLRVLL
ncbi:MAG: hypothetical protein AAGC96_20160, partial [Pseudomonadota bacterium]